MCCFALKLLFGGLGHLSLDFACYWLCCFVKLLLDLDLAVMFEHLRDCGCLWFGSHGGVCGKLFLVFDVCVACLVWIGLF